MSINTEDTRRIYLARQPIFDAQNLVYAYELLYRGTENAVAADGEPSAMGPRVMVDSLLGMGLHEVTGGRPAFVNVDHRMIKEGSVELLEPEQVILEVVESVDPDDAETMAALERLTKAGYRIALDDFEMRPGVEPLLVLASVVKIDVLQHSPEELAAVVASTRPYGAALLAEKVEDPEMHKRCVDMGFSYFQGFHFSRPKTLARTDLSIEQYNVMRLLNAVNDSSTSDVALEKIFRGDVSLSYKLLRMVNSAAMGGRGISSIGHALRLLGRKSLYRWLALMLTSGGSGRGPRGEMVHSALLRARMAELIALETGHSGEAPALYLAGLFSRLDALLNTPIEELVDHLDLRPEVHQVLTGRRGPLAPMLLLVEAYEEGRWSDIAGLARVARAGDVDLRMAYVSALREADQYMAAFSADPAANAGVEA